MTTQRPEAGAPADQRREQMLAAAVEVICERGFPDTRIADVAERAGTSPALVIYYFKSKDQLLTEAIRFSEDHWYETGTSRLAAIDSAAGRLEELVAMSLLPEKDAVQPPVSWTLWLELWAQAARHAEVAAVRAADDERWRRTLADLVREGMSSGEFGDVDADDFAVTFSALLDGFAVQVALGDRVVDAQRAFRLAMSQAAEMLGFDWTPARGRRGWGRPARAAGGSRR